MPPNPTRSSPFLVATLAVVMGVSCDQGTASPSSRTTNVTPTTQSSASAVAQAPSFFEAAGIDALSPQLKQSAGEGERALELVIQPHMATLKIVDPSTPAVADWTVYRSVAGSIRPMAKAQKAVPEGARLFALGAVRLAAIPELVKEAQAQAQIPESAVKQVSLRRDAAPPGLAFHALVVGSNRAMDVVATPEGKIVDRQEIRIDQVIID